MTTVSMKMLDFEGLERFENHQILVQNGFINKKNYVRSANVVAKRLRKPFWTENCALHRLAVLWGGYFLARVPPTKILRNLELST